ncbi:MAG: GNAT family N-acetyltransferase [Aestuariibacter sp.]|nr:GNAT family N-acetyltransferase [Aestuariibacter sp.]
MKRHEIVLRENGSYLRGYYDKHCNVARVQNLIVHSSQRRKGVGTRLYEQFLDIVKEQQIPLVVLEVFKFNKVGKKFWAGKGFKIVDETIDEYYECEVKIL